MVFFIQNVHMYLLKWDIVNREIVYMFGAMSKNFYTKWMEHPVEATHKYTVCWEECSDELNWKIQWYIFLDSYAYILSHGTFREIKFRHYF